MFHLFLCKETGMIMLFFYPWEKRVVLSSYFKNEGVNCKFHITSQTKGGIYFSRSKNLKKWGTWWLRLVKCLPLAQVVMLGSWVWAPTMGFLLSGEPASPPAHLPALSFSQINIYLKKKHCKDSHDYVLFKKLYLPLKKIKLFTPLKKIKLSTPLEKKRNCI